MENPQVNSIWERIEQVIENIARTFDLQDNDLDDYEPWLGILEDKVFALQSTCNNMLKATQGLLVFGCDMILNTPFIANWESIRQGKQKLIEKVTKLKKNLTAHMYNTGIKYKFVAIFLTKMRSLT